MKFEIPVENRPCVQLSRISAFGKTEGKVKSLGCDRSRIPTFAKRKRIWAIRLSQIATHGNSRCFSFGMDLPGAHSCRNPCGA